MGAISYSIVFSGELADGLDQAQVAARLATLFRQPPEKVDRIFAGRPVILKKDISLEEAERYRDVFLHAGAVCEIKGVSHIQRAPIAKDLDHNQSPPEVAPQPQRSQRSARNPALTLDNLPDFFNGEVKRIPPTVGYRLGLLGVALAMLALPLTYLALTASTGYFLYWWTTYAFGMLPQWGVYIRILLYVVPAIVGVVLFIFMLKPLFAGGNTSTSALILSRSEEPLFFAFIDEVCDAVGAPRPKFIQVDSQVNAAASFFRNRWIGKHHLVLTVGLPIFAGMSTRELAGILAHEFGHFAQGAGMRATHLIRAINYWFYHSVHHRDRWDERLERYALDSDDGWIAITFQIARGAVWMVRRLLSGLMYVGDLISHYMLRQMEFDADRYEAQIAGSHQFKSTSLRLRLLGYAHQSVHADLARLWEDRRLVDDIAGMVVDKAADMEPSFFKHADTILREEQTQIFDTHPADLERIERVQRLAAPGVFDLEIPARYLLRNFESLAKETTRRLYVSALGIKPTEAQLVGVQEMKSAVARAEAQEDALISYCRDLFLPQRFLAIPTVHGLVALAESRRKAALESAIDELRGAGPEIHQLVERYQEADDALTTAYIYHTFEHHGLECAAPGTPNIDKAHDAFGQTARALDPFEARLTERLATALAGRWLSLDKDGRDTLTRVLDTQAGLHRLQNEYDSFAREAATLYHMMQLAAACNESDSSQAVMSQRAFHNQLTCLQGERDRIADALSTLAYPFERAGGSQDIWSHFSEELPEIDSLTDVLQHAMSLIQCMERLHVRVMGYLTQLATELERGLGVAPIKVELATDNRSSTALQPAYARVSPPEQLF